MSHRSDCKDPWEARREGERAYEWGGSNPYRHGDAFESFEDRHCRERSESEWRTGYNRAEIAAEERAEEEAHERRAAERRYKEQQFEECEEPEQFIAPPVIAADDDLPF